MSDINDWAVIVVAYQLPGKPWQKKTPKTKGAYAKLIAKLVGAGAEIKLTEAK